MRHFSMPVEILGMNNSAFMANLVTDDEEKAVMVEFKR